MGASDSAFVRSGTLAQIASIASSQPESPMSTRNHIPNTVEASLGARLAPFCGVASTPLEDLDVEASRAVSPRPARPERRLLLSLVNDLKLLFAALGACGIVLPR